MGGVRTRPIMKVLAVSAGLALLVGLVDPYRRDRILSFLNPGAHQSGSGYQVWQSLIGLGSGHLFGLGLGGGRQKWGLLPNAHTDFIFSVVGEELGLVGAVVLLGLFFALAWLGFRAATRAPDRFGSLLAVGITVWITSQAVINVGAVVGVLPVTGIPLPFISFGGSSLVITMAAVGILINIASQRAGGAGRPAAPAQTVPRVNGERYALVAGGGTAGHLQPALAIAEALVEAGHPRETIEFVGSTRGQDRDTLEGRGFPIVLLPGRGVVRSLKPKHLLANARASAELLAGAFSAYRVVTRARPRVVVSVGGYASVGPALAAVVRGVPLVLVNVDAVPGAANRLFARVGACLCGGVGRHAASACNPHRHTGSPGDREGGALFGAASCGSPCARSSRRPPHGRHRRRVARRAFTQRGGGGAGRPVGGPGRPFDLPRSRATRLGPLRSLGEGLG